MVTVCSWVVAGLTTGVPVVSPATDGAQIPINPESDVGPPPRGPSPALGLQLVGSLGTAVIPRTRRTL
ncbi:putative secreted protein [Candidatus Protofrankia californiensis]|uniref:Putative secreted protein n=1 Tax=Candidatus Protofrankia californiensis TaxID=1839754 RepID=A0A1C3PGN2_9ACTN|nr:putative secreted protein [Candidatus Protofrankia californiensis]